jgi:hypothetical protein
VTGQIIIRDQFTELPMPDSVIHHMNALAKVEGVTPDASLKFSMGSFVIDGTQEPHQGVELVIDNEVRVAEEPYVFADDVAADPNIINVVHRADVPADSVSPQPVTASIGSPTLAREEDPLSLEPDPLHTNTAPISVYPGSESPADFQDPEFETQASVLPDIPERQDPAEVGQVSSPTRQVDSEPSSTPAQNTRSRARGVQVRFDPRTHEKIAMPTSAVKAQSRLSDQRFHAHSYNISVAKSLKTMKRSALEAIFQEIVQIHGKGVFSPASLSLKRKKKAIRSFMFLKEKYKADGAFDKLKARLVAGGHMQDRSEILYEDASSPTAALPFVFMIAAIAARERRHVATVDITGAFLNADISKQEIVMDLDPQMAAMLIMIDPSYEQHLNPNGTITVVLNKALYGCVESSKLWYDLLSITLEQDGFVRNPIDRCVFNKTVDGVQCTAVVYVDDIFITCTNPAVIEQVTAMLRDKFKSITEHSGKIHSYLGMQWDFTTDGEVKVSMDGYTSELMSATGVTGVERTPAADHLFDVRSIASKLDEKQSQEFHSTVAKILYLAKRVRPDILLATSFLSTRVQSPDTDDLRKLNRMLKYINGTQSLGIVLRPGETLTIDAFIDAS